MRRFCHLWLLFLICSSARLVSQDRPASVSIFGTLSTTSELFHHPNDPDLLLRSEYYPLNVIFGGGTDIRYAIAPLRCVVGASVEIMSKSETFSISTSGISSSSHQLTTVDVPVQDGYVVVPAELSVYVPLPIGNDIFQVYIGGGGGAYFGKRNYSYGGVEITTTDHTTGFGIHILSGAEYQMTPAFSLRTEFKFRDVHFETTGSFPEDQTSVENLSVTLPRGPQEARINVDGLAIAIQLAYHF